MAVPLADSGWVGRDEDLPSSDRRRIVLGTVHLVESAVVTSVLRHRGVRVGSGARFYGPPLVRLAPGSEIRIGDRFVGASRSGCTALGVQHRIILRTVRLGAVIDIGDDVGISGASVCAAARVSIGTGCLVGANVTIADTDFHPVRHPARRYAPMPVPTGRDAVVIGDNVFLGAGSMILRGARIGDDAVVGAGVVVRGHVPPGTVVRRDHG